MMYFAYNIHHLSIENFDSYRLFISLIWVFKVVQDLVKELSTAGSVTGGNNMMGLDELLGGAMGGGMAGGKDAGGKDGDGKGKGDAKNGGKGKGDGKNDGQSDGKGATSPSTPSNAADLEKMFNDVLLSVDAAGQKSQGFPNNKTGPAAGQDECKMQ
jgi:hypothetical protein